MLTVTDGYKAAIKARGRAVVAKVNVYFDGEGELPTTFYNDSLGRLYFLEEARADTSNPLGVCSANEVTIAFRNDDRAFTPTNESSPYYGLLLPNVRVEPYLGVMVRQEPVPPAEVGELEAEWVALGVFWTSDWSAPSSDLVATVTCYDIIYKLGNLDMPALPIVPNTTAGELFEMLCEAIGLTAGEYEVDAALNYPISMGWLPGGLVKEAFQALILGANCSIVSTRAGKLKAYSNFSLVPSVATWTEHDQIINVNLPQRYLDTYSQVGVIYKLPYLEASSTLLQISQLAVPAGGVVLQRMPFSSGPAGRIRRIELIGAENVVVSAFQYDAWTITITLTNSGPTEIIDLNVYGQVVKTVDSEFVVEDAALKAIIGEKKLVIDSYLIQSRDMAVEYATVLLRLVSNPATRLTMTVRGDPAIELTDVFTVTNTRNLIGTVEITPIRFTYDWTGGLRATCLGIRTDVLELYDWTCVSPGLYIYGRRGVSV